MSKQFVIAQAGSSGSTAAPVQIIKVIKPPAGHTEVFHASFTGTVKVDFTAIANEKITLYHDNTDQTLHIIFTDGSQAIIEPFFDSTGVLSNMSIEVAPNQDLNGAQFAAQFPITEDQTVLPAAGAGAPGTPPSGADFTTVSVDPLAVPPPLPLLPPETLPPITFTDTLGAALPTTPLVTTITVGPGLPLVVDESFIPGIGSQQPPSGSNSAVVDESSAFNVSGGGATTTYSLTLNGTSTGLTNSKTGTAVTLVQVDATHINAVDGAGTHDVVFTLSLDSSTGVVTMTDLRGVHEASPDVGTDSNESITLASGLVSLTATNGAVSADLDLGSLITIKDDGPVVTGTTSGEPTLVVDESFIPGIGSGTGAAGSSIATGTFTSLFNVTPGADGLNGSTVYSLTLNGTSTGLTDSKTGTAVTLVQVDATHINAVDGAGTHDVVFTLSLDSSTGVVTMTELRGVEQSTGSNPDTSEGITLASGLVSLTATVTDNDGDSASSSVDLGHAITIKDDGPVVTGTTSGEPTLVVDESFIPGIGSGTGAAGSSIATGTFTSLFNVTPGADGLNGSTVYSLTLNGTSTGLTDSKTGTAVTLVQVDATHINAVDGAGTHDVVFTLSLDSSTGVVTMTELRGVEQSTGSNPDTSEGITLASGLVSLTATVTDNDGDSASSSVDLGHAITIKDDGPVVTGTTSGEPTLVVDESFIPGIGSGTGAAGSSIATGTFTSLFNVTPGADGLNGSTVYSLTLNGTSTGLINSKTGTAVTLVQVDATHINAVDGAGTHDVVFTLALNSSTGVVTMTELRGVEQSTASNPDTSEGITLASGLVSLTATVTDNDGDSASSSVDLGHAITINDDGPVVTATTSGEPTLVVDESFIPGIGSGTGAAGSSIATGTFTSLFNVTPGADGLNGSAVYSLTLNGTSTGLINSKTGTAVTLVQVDATHINAVDGAGTHDVVFTLALNSSTGVVTMTELRGVEQSTASNPDTSEGITLASGLVSLTATVTDNDGDSASSSVDLGHAITIHDDGPVVTATTSGEPTLVVDESFIPGIGSGTGAAGSSIATGTFTSLFNVTPGADGLNGSAVYSLTLNGTSTGLIDSKTGTAVTLVQVDATHINAVDGAGTHDVVFTLALNSSTGVVTMTELRGVEQSTASNPDTSEGITLASGLVSLTATVTDNDGDSASSSVDLGHAITINDDGPVVTATTSGEPTLVVDESFIPGIGSGTGAAGSSIATGTFTSLFNVTPGADGLNGSAVYSLTLNGTSTGLINSKTGTAVTLVQVDATHINAVDGAGTHDVVFTLALNSSTGVVTMTELRGVEQSTASNPDTSEGITLASGLVSLTATVTDNDGDSASSSVDLGHAITINDDGPVVTATTSGEPTLVVDESFIPGIGSGTGAAGSSIATGTFTSLFNVTPGADGLNGSAVYSLTLNGTSTGLINSKTGTAVTLVQVDATHINAVDGAGTHDVVFTLALNSSTGVVTMTELRGVEQSTASNPDTSEGITLASGLVSLTATVTDNDGDSASSSVDLGHAITINDDGPVITAEQFDQSGLRAVSLTATVTDNDGDQAIASLDLGPKITILMTVLW